MSVKIVYEVTVEYGNTFWRLNGFLHREDGPAIEYESGTKIWYKNDKLHREDGTAVEYISGEKHWYLDDKGYTEENFNKEIARRKSSCNGKIVEVDGKKYTLKEIVE